MLASTAVSAAEDGDNGNFPDRIGTKQTEPIEMRQILEQLKENNAKLGEQHGMIKKYMEDFESNQTEQKQQLENVVNQRYEDLKTNILQGVQTTVDSSRTHLKTKLKKQSKHESKELEAMRTHLETKLKEQSKQESKELEAIIVEKMESLHTDLDAADKKSDELKEHLRNQVEGIAKQEAQLETLELAKMHNEKLEMVEAHEADREKLQEDAVDTKKELRKYEKITAVTAATIGVGALYKFYEWMISSPKEGAPQNHPERNSS